MFRLSIVGNGSFSPPTRADESKNSALQILIVEDDEADAYLIKGLLTAHPRIASVVRAVDGVDALEMLSAGFNPDLAFIDLHMPRMNGFALVQEIGSKRLHFPMIVLTSSTAPSDMARRRLNGANQILSKPVAVSQMRSLLGNAINSIAA